eukprot:12935760-Heterocapsa_arctica.AAC.1
MVLRSTGTDGVLFIENAEKNDGYRVVRMTFGTALLPEMDMNVDFLRSVFSASAEDIDSLKEKIKASWM